MRHRIRTVIAANNDGHYLRALVAGEKEVPGAGDPDGWGRTPV